MTIKHETTLRLHKLWLKGDEDGVRADLWGANLEGADLEGADLGGANLEDANLRDAYLAGADIRGAYLAGADLRGADLMDVKLEYADLINADLKGAKIDYQIQDGLLREIEKIILENPESLEMGSWHTCETTHCLAGWACHLNPVAKGLEKTHGAAIAGLLTLGYEAHAYFFKENEETIEWLKTIKD